jgi:excisionase family DNA binding protein
MPLQIAAVMNSLEQLRTAVAALPPGTLVTLPREGLLDVLGGPAGDGEVAIRSDGPHATAVDLTVTDLAQRFGRHPSTIRQWLESGQLEGYKLLGREWRVPAVAVAAFQDRQRQAQERRASPGRGTPSLADWRKSRDTQRGLPSG